MNNDPSFGAESSIADIVLSSKLVFEVIHSRDGSYQYYRFGFTSGQIEYFKRWCNGQTEFPFEPAPFNIPFRHEIVGRVVKSIPDEYRFKRFQTTPKALDQLILRGYATLIPPRAIYKNR